MIETTQLIYLLLVFLCLSLSAFFTSAETAFIALQKIRIKHLEATGVAGAARVARIAEKPAKLLATVLLSNNFVQTVAAALATAAAIHQWGEKTGLIAASIAMTLLTLVFSEVIPKTIAAHHAEKIALLYVRPIEWITWFLSPLTVALSWLGSLFTRMVGQPAVPPSLVSEEEIRSMITMGQEEGSMAETEAQMLHKVFKFGDRPLREVMIPRPDIVWLDQDMKVGDFLSVFAQSPHARFPAYKESTDNVVGFLSIKDVLKAQAEDNLVRESPVEQLIRPISFVPENKKVAELFAEMQASGNQMAMVVDEYGGLAGLVTLEQLVEEIVGEVRDELAIEEREFEAIDERTFEMDGSLRVEEANEKLGLGLPPGDYETVAGYVLNRLGRIPRIGEQVKYSRLKLVVTEMRGVKIEKIRVSWE